MIKGFWKKIPLNFYYYLLAFAFPFLCMITAFAIINVYPMGSHMMLVVDSYHQYAPFLIELRSKLLSGGSLFYSMNDGLGTEYYAAMANYCSSPLNIFVVLFTAKAVPVFIALVTAVRAGLCSLFTSMFLSSEDSRRVDLITVSFGSLFALCGWFLTDYWNIMWCDALVLLPLIALGLRRLFKEGKYLLYVISLAVCIISNYYTGFFICVFLIFFAPVYFFMINDGNEISPKTFIKSAGRFVLGSLTGGMISAIIVIPTYLILQHCSATGDTFPVDYTLTGNLFDFLGRFMVAANPNIRDGMANVSCGTICVLLLPLFFAARPDSGIKLKHKIGYGFLLLLLYLSFTNRMLNFIWHGFHFPNQIPYRESFLMSFVIVMVCFKTIRVLKRFSAAQLTAVTTGALVFLVLYEKFGEGNEGYAQILLTLLFVIVQSAVLRSIKYSTRTGGFFHETLLMATIFIEALTTTCVTVGLVARHEGSTSYATYGQKISEVQDYVESVEGSEGHNTFERTAVYPSDICDIQAVYGVKGLDIFSSTARENFVKYMSNFGFHNNGINGLRNAGLTRVTATIFGIRNLVEVSDTQTIPCVFDEEYSDDAITVFGNPDALSVGFMVSEDILDYTPMEVTDVFAKTNDWIRSMGLNSEVYKPVSIYNTSTEGVTYTGSSTGVLRYSSSATDQVSLSFTMTGTTPGSDMLVYSDSSQLGSVMITYSDGSTRNFQVRRYSIINLGVSDGTDVEVTLTYSDPPSGLVNVYGYELNTDSYNDMLDLLSDEQLQVEGYSDTMIKGTIDVKHDGLMLLTIPYSEGFKCTVDGEETGIVSVGDALMGIELSEGEHTIILHYEPAGFGIGAAVSLAGVMMLVGIQLFITQRNKRASLRIETSNEDDSAEN